MIKKIILGVTFSFLSLFLILPICNITESYAATVEDEVAQPYNDLYHWYYKEVDGQRYMRLWDVKNCCWVTNWILVD